MNRFNQEILEISQELKLGLFIFDGFGYVETYQPVKLFFNKYNISLDQKLNSCTLQFSVADTNLAPAAIVKFCIRHQPQKPTIINCCKRPKPGI